MKGSHRTLDDWLSDIDQMATKVAEHTRGMSRSDFNSNEPVIDLVTKKLENIGEAVKWITKNFTEFAEVHSNVPWSKLARTGTSWPMVTSKLIATCFGRLRKTTFLSSIAKSNRSSLCGKRIKQQQCALRITGSVGTDRFMPS